MIDVQCSKPRTDEIGSQDRGTKRGSRPQKQNYTSANFLQAILLTGACGTTKDSLQLGLQVSRDYSVQRRTSKDEQDRETEMEAP